jgi:oligosaccharyltransferase complex subunit beta
MSCISFRCIIVGLIVAIAVMTSSTTSLGVTENGQGKRLLVLLDNFAMRETHSIFFKSLRDRNFQVTFKVADDSDLTLTKYGEYIFDHLVLFCPNVVEFGGNLTTKSVVDFIDAGGNVLVAANSELSEPIKEIAGECGIEFSDESTYVIDRFNTDIKDNGRNTLIVSDVENLINNKIIAGNAREKAVPFLYRGIGMTADPENPLLLDILAGSTTTYTYKPDETIADYPHSIGKTTLLISGLQARNNARAVFVGSLEFFSNEFFESSVQKVSSTKKFDKSGNEELSIALSQWVFKEKGVLRAGVVNHHKEGQKAPPTAYTINENIAYTIQIEEIVNGKWEPFQANDVQLEFVRLDPFVRTLLTPSKTGVFEAKYKLPDIYGIFKFVVNYNRIGYTHLFSSTQVSVRPLEHTAYERFIPSAYPYYVSAFSMIVAVFFFSFIQLYHRDAPAASTTKKTE